MCTVSILRTSDGKIVLTSNRDERTNRATLPPDILDIEGQKILCPLDMEKGGTWIAAGNNGRVACLLNGAFEKHIPTGKESISRGKILMQAFGNGRFDEFVSAVELRMTEPFTLVVLDPTSYDFVHELVWDGRSKHYRLISVDEVNFWSSVTLYSEEMRTSRIEEYSSWRKSTPAVTEEEILELHAGNEFEDGFVLHGSTLRTVSVTQVVLESEKVKMGYNDLLTGEQFNKQLRWERVLH